MLEEELGVKTYTDEKISCPYCNYWWDMNDVADTLLDYAETYDIVDTTAPHMLNASELTHMCKCQHCHKEFMAELHVFITEGWEAKKLEDVKD